MEQSMTWNDNNPYRDALVGLEIEDPVQAFFDFCIERERIRSKREAGEPPPWTDDLVFQNGRFLNVFREDDKGTKAVLCFADPVKDSVSDLIHALFFARWCNQHIILLTLEPRLLRKPKELRHALLKEVPQPWFSEVYPVVPACWDGHAYNRLEACVEMFLHCLDFMERCIRSARGNVMQANDSINAQLQMSNDFPIFMALVDLAFIQARFNQSGQPGSYRHWGCAISRPASAASQVRDPSGNSRKDDRSAKHVLAAGTQNVYAHRY
jgi:hypothetical protein